MIKQTIKLTLRIKPEHDPPDIGNGPGIIATQEIVISEEQFGKAFSETFLIASAINTTKQELIKQFIEVITEEI